MNKRRSRTIERLKLAKETIKKENALKHGNTPNLRSIIAKKILEFKGTTGGSADRASYRKTAAQLNKEGVLTPEGKVWTAQDVYSFVNQRWADARKQGRWE